MLGWLGVLRELADNPSKRRRMRCRRLTMYSSNPSEPRETSGPRIDRIPLAWPPWRDRQYREFKKNKFSAPSTCPIDRFGPVSNERTVKQRHAAPHLKPDIYSPNRLILKMGARRCLRMSLGVSWDVYCDVGQPRRARRHREQHLLGIHMT